MDWGLRGDFEPRVVKVKEYLQLARYITCTISVGNVMGGVGSVESTVLDQDKGVNDAAVFSQVY